MTKTKTIRCQKEFERIMSGSTESPRVIAYAFFVGELVVNMKVCYLLPCHISKYNRKKLSPFERIINFILFLQTSYVSFYFFKFNFLDFYREMRDFRYIYFFNKLKFSKNSTLA